MKLDKAENNDCYELALSFANLTEESYSFLKKYNDYSFTFGQYDYKTKKIREISKPLHPLFDIRAIIAFSEYEINISYGDREFIIIPTFKYNKYIYGMWEILKANNIESLNAVDSQFVLDYKRMAEVISKQAHIFKQNLRVFLTIDKTTIDIINNNRTETQDQWLKKIKEQELLRAYQEARSLFKNKKYDDAMRKLESYKEYFNNSQKMFYKLCERKKNDRPTTAST